MSYYEETGGRYKDMLEEMEELRRKQRVKQARLDHMYMEIAEVFAKQSHALRSRVGAVLVKGTNIISAGWNGQPAGMDNVCEFEQYDQVGKKYYYRTKDTVLHAELNCLAKIAASTQSSEGSTLYVTLAPCIDCSKLIAQSMIKRVVYRDDYRDPAGVKLLNELKIEVEQLHEQPTRQDEHSRHAAELVGDTALHRC